MNNDQDEQPAQATEPRAEAIAGARWWTAQLRAGNQGSAGDAHVDGMLSWARSVSNDSSCSEEALGSFEAELAKLIEADIAERWTDAPDWVWYVTLSVDYGPDVVLAAAAEASGINTGNPSLVFPVKTTMWIDRGRIKVSAGYRAAEQTIWVSDEGAAHWATLALTKCAEELNAISEGMGRARG